jgi:glycosyltransferase involved in cell wall biosynthesis
MSVEERRALLDDLDGGSPLSRRGVPMVAIGFSFVAAGAIAASAWLWTKLETERASLRQAEARLAVETVARQADAAESARKLSAIEVDLAIARLSAKEAEDARVRNEKAADALIATSDQQEALFRRQFPVAPGRLHKVYNGMDLETFVPAEGDDALRTQLAIPAGAPVLLCIARFVRDKGLRFVVDALPAIAKAHPDVHLVLVGDGEERLALTAQVERLGVARHLHFTGYVPLNDLPRYFANSDLFVNATIRRNGYDLTMVEAMACGRVVVSSDVGSTPTLIADDVDGLLVPIGDSRALANRIIGALNDRQRLKQMGARAREKAVSAFGLSTMVERTIEVYDAIRSTHAQP